MEITFSEGVFVVLGIQQAMRMRLFCCYLWPVQLYIILLLSVVCPAVHYFVVIWGLSSCTLFCCYLWSVQLYIILLLSVVCPAVHYFFTLSHKQHFFFLNKFLNLKRLLPFSLQSLSGKRYY
jgi:hypothetical protein